MSGKRHLYPNDFKACDNCRGKGTVYCSSCNGRGQRETRRYTSSGYTETERNSCSICLGTGARMCNYCNGTGDQRIYAMTYPAVDEATVTPDEGAELGEVDIDRLQQNYSALYDAKLQEAEQQRQEIVAWIWNAHAFSIDYKSSITSWLNKLILDHTETSALLEGTAQQLHQPGLPTQAGTLGYMLGGLASSCSLLDMYKTMIK